MTTMNWGQQKAADHMKAFPAHVAIGSADLWTCADCDALIPIQEVTEKMFKALKHVLNDIRNSQGKHE